MTDFLPFPKIPRLNREIVITEKIDGTNAQIMIEEGSAYCSKTDIAIVTTDDPDRPLIVRAGSRKRWITPEDDNFGFARWAQNNVLELVKLGPGQHFGEWWGSGIQRGYGLEKGEKRFSLFNVGRWIVRDDEGTPAGLSPDLPDCVGVVPLLYEGPFNQYAIERAANYLDVFGSHAAPYFMKPEGIIIYHTAARQLFKVLLENDNLPKGEAA